jgi:hypothetical protein
VPDVAIVSSMHHPADGRLVRWERAFRAAGLDVTIVGRTTPAGGWRGVARRLRAAVVLPWRTRASVVLVPDPELAVTALPARWLRRGSILVADVHEEYTQIAYDRAWARGGRRLLAQAAALVATRASALADVTVLADAHYPPHRARRRIVVPNVPARHELGSAGPAEGQLRAVYVGDVRMSRGLGAMVDAVLDAPPWELDVVGPISDADRAWALERASGASDRVRVHGRLAPSDAWRVATGAAAGLCLLQDTPAFRRQMPTKVYEYLAVGLPVLATALPRLEPLLPASHAGELVTSTEGAATVLRRWRDQPAVLAAHRSAATIWADEHLPVTSPFDETATFVAEMIRQR